MNSFPTLIALVVIIPIVGCATQPPPPRASEYGVRPPQRERQALSDIPETPTEQAESAAEVYRALAEAIEVKSLDGPIRPIDVWPPEFPSEAIEKKVEGVVEIGLVVETDGTVRYARVTQSVHPILDRACLRAVRTWRFEPMTSGGKPVRVRMIQRFVMRR